MHIMTFTLLPSMKIYLILIWSSFFFYKAMKSYQENIVLDFDPRVYTDVFFKNTMIFFFISPFRIGQKIRIRRTEPISIRINSTKFEPN